MEAGTGPPMLLIHGWACDHEAMQPQIDHFRQTHHVVAPDLRGHGRSPKGEPYTIATFAEDVRALCRNMGIEKPVIAGHSMGGLIAYSLADIASAVIAIDSPLAMPARYVDIIHERGQGSGTPDGCRRAVEPTFLPTDDLARKEWLIAKMCATDPRVREESWDAIFASANANAETAEPIHVPLLAIGTAAPMFDLRRLKELTPRLHVGQTVGSGHFAQLEVPEQVNAMIERFLKIVVT